MKKIVAITAAAAPRDAPDDMRRALSEEHPFSMAITLHQNLEA